MKTEMNLFFEGAAGTVTGSCNRLEYSCGDVHHQILVDCGVIQDYENAAISIPEWRFNPSEIDCVLLTHAHIDHCGAIPLLYARGFSGKVYATEATIELSKVMLLDAAETSELYNSIDVNKIKWSSVDDYSQGNHIKKNTFFPILPNIHALFIRSSHILGASSIYIRWFKEVIPENKGHDANNSKVILFSGDVGRNFDGLNEKSTFLKPNQLPFPTETPEQEIYVIESTYGNRFHKKNTNHAAKLEFLTQTLKQALSDDGYVVIPAFALDRTQTILGDIYDILKSTRICDDTMSVTSEIEKIENSKHSRKEEGEKIKQLEEKIIKVYSISPLGNKINYIYKDLLGRNSKYMDDKGLIKFKYLNAIPEIPESFLDEQNKNTDKTLNDNILEVRLKCLTRLPINKECANCFKFSSERMKSQNKEKDPCSFIGPRSIIVGASGTCDKGYILPVIEKALKDEKATIILTGYTPKGSTGDALKKLTIGICNSDLTKQDIFNKRIPQTSIRFYEVKAKILDMSDYYSAHADQNELITYIFNNPEEKFRRTSPIQVFLNHGTAESGNELACKIDEWNCKLGGENIKTIVTSKTKNAFDISGDVVEVIG